MEKIIIYALIIAIGVLFEYIKKRARGDQSSKPVSQTPQHKSISQATIQALVTEASPASIGLHKPTKAKRDKTRPAMPAPPKPIRQECKKIFLPGEQIKSRATTAYNTAISDNNSEHQTATDVSEHFARWRKAIIDAEIIQRKF